jgi:hypothetical protein
MSGDDRGLRDRLMRCIVAIVDRFVILRISTKRSRNGPIFGGLGVLPILLVSRRSKNLRSMGKVAKKVRSFFSLLTYSENMRR